MPPWVHSRALCAPPGLSARPRRAALTGGSGLCTTGTSATTLTTLRSSAEPFKASEDLTRTYPDQLRPGHHPQWPDPHIDLVLSVVPRADDPNIPARRSRGGEREGVHLMQIWTHFATHDRVTEGQATDALHSPLSGANQPPPRARRTTAPTTGKYSRTYLGRHHQATTRRSHFSSPPRPCSRSPFGNSAMPFSFDAYFAR